MAWSQTAYDQWWAKKQPLKSSQSPSPLVKRNIKKTWICPWARTNRHLQHQHAEWSWLRELGKVWIPTPAVVQQSCRKVGLYCHDALSWIHSLSFWPKFSLHRLWGQQCFPLSSPCCQNCADANCWTVLSLLETVMQLLWIQLNLFMLCRLRIWMKSEKKRL